MSAYESVYAICPFYKDETKCEIKCEGVVSCSVINKFENTVQKREHEEKYCYSLMYRKCALSKRIFKKYEEGKI